MRLENIDVESSCHDKYEARVTFVTTSPSEVNYLLNKRNKDFRYRKWLYFFSNG